MAVVAELQEQIMDALGDGEQKTKPQLAKEIEGLSGAHLASALRVLKREGRIIVGSDGSKRVYRLPGATRG
jgi:DNA-binding HxlR family transcriptional regulator